PPPWLLGDLLSPKGLKGPDIHAFTAPSATRYDRWRSDEGEVGFAATRVSGMDIKALNPLDDGDSDGLVSFGSASGCANWPHPAGVLRFRDGCLAIHGAPTVEGDEAATGAERTTLYQSADEFGADGPEEGVEADDLTPIP
ncbi:unnamed protein product, partial [Prorocentrum cordatum]